MENVNLKFFLFSECSLARERVYTFTERKHYYANKMKISQPRAYDVYGGKGNGVNERCMTEVSDRCQFYYLSTLYNGLFFFLRFLSILIFSSIQPSRIPGHPAQVRRPPASFFRTDFFWDFFINVSDRGGTTALRWRRSSCKKNSLRPRVHCRYINQPLSSDSLKI